MKELGIALAQKYIGLRKRKGKPYVLRKPDRTHEGVTLYEWDTTKGVVRAEHLAGGEVRWVLVSGASKTVREKAKPVEPAPE